MLSLLSPRTKYWPEVKNKSFYSCVWENGLTPYFGALKIQKNHLQNRIYWRYAKQTSHHKSRILSIFIPEFYSFVLISPSLCLLPPESPHSRWRFPHCPSVSQSEASLPAEWPMREQARTWPLIPRVLTPDFWPGSASSLSPPRLSPF